MVSSFLFILIEFKTAGIEKLLKERDKAKIDADFGLADAIREKFNSVGIIIQDTPEGTKWDISSKINHDKLKDL